MVLAPANGVKGKGGRGRNDALSYYQRQVDQQWFI